MKTKKQILLKLISLLIIFSAYFNYGVANATNNFVFYNRDQYPKNVQYTNDSLAEEISIFSKYVYKKLERCSENKANAETIEAGGFTGGSLLTEKKGYSFCPGLDYVDRIRLQFIMQAEYFSTKSTGLVMGADAKQCGLNKDGSCEYEVASIPSIKYPLEYDQLVFNDLSGKEYCLDPAKECENIPLINIMLRNINYNVSEEAKREDIDCNESKNSTAFKCVGSIKARTDKMKIAKKTNEELIREDNTETPTQPSIEDTPNPQNAPAKITDIYSTVSLAFANNVLFQFGSLKNSVDMLSSLSINNNKKNNWIKENWIPLTNDEKEYMKTFKDIEKITVSYTKADSNCAGRGVNAILCMGARAGATTASQSFAILEKLFQVNPNVLARSSVGEIWGKIRTYTNFLVVIFLIVTAIMYVSNQKLNYYNLKTLIPKIVLVVIFINISYYLILIATDISNIIGANISKFTDSIIKSFDPENKIGMKEFYSEVTSILKAGIPISMAGAVIISLAGGFSFIFPTIVAGLITFFIMFLSIGVRELMIVVLTILAPIFIFTKLLPDEKYYKQWKKILISMLLVYPISALLWNFGILARAVIKISDPGVFVSLLSYILLFVPFLILPKIINKAIENIPIIGGTIMNKLGALNKVSDSVKNSEILRTARQKTINKYKQKASNAISKPMFNKMRNSNRRIISPMGNFMGSIYGTPKIDPERLKNIIEQSSSMQFEEAQENLINYDNINHDVLMASILRGSELGVPIDKNQYILALAELATNQSENGIYIQAILGTTHRNLLNKGNVELSTIFKEIYKNDTFKKQPSSEFIRSLEESVRLNDADKVLQEIDKHNHTTTLTDPLQLKNKIKETVRNMSSYESIDLGKSSVLEKDAIKEELTDQKAQAKAKGPQYYQKYVKKLVGNRSLSRFI